MSALVPRGSPRSASTPGRTSVPAITLLFLRTFSHVRCPRLYIAGLQQTLPVSNISTSCPPRLTNHITTYSTRPCRYYFNLKTCQQHTQPCLQERNKHPVSSHLRSPLDLARAKLLQFHKNVVVVVGAILHHEKADSRGASSPAIRDCLGTYTTPLRLSRTVVPVCAGAQVRG